MALSAVPLDGQIITGYLRGDHIRYGWIGDDHLNKTDDIIYMNAYPDAQGNILWRSPHFNLKVEPGISVLNSFKDKTGVYVARKGTEVMSNTSNIPLIPNSLESWTFEGNYIPINSQNPLPLFESDGKRFYIQKNQLIFSNSSETYSANFEPDKSNTRQHFAITCNKGQYSIFQNGKKLNITTQKASNTQQTKEVIGIPGKASDIRIWCESRQPVFLGKDLTPTWHDRNVRAKWDASRAKQPGFSTDSWTNDILWIRSKLKNQKSHMVRLGIAGGEWKDMLRDEKAQENFAQQVQELVKQFPIDGIDLDFEWIEGAYQGDNPDKQWQNYAKLARNIRKKAPSTCFTISLHVVCYKMPKEGIDAVDYFTMQNYGPSKTPYSFENFAGSLDKFRKHGFPNKKLQLSVPFQGTLGKTASSVRLYRDIIAANPTIDRAQNEVLYSGGMMTFNGAEMIRKKAEFIKKEKLRGVMYWDMGGDAAKGGNKGVSDYNHTHALLPVLNEVLKGKP